MASFLTHPSSAFYEGCPKQNKIVIEMLDPTVTYHAAPAPAAPALPPADQGFDFAMEVSGSNIKVKANKRFGQITSERLSHSVMASTSEAQQQAQQQATIVALGSIVIITIGSIIGLAIWRMTGR